MQIQKLNSTLFADAENISNFVKNELFEGIALQIAEIRTVAKSLPASFQNSAKCLFLNRLNQIDENLK